MSEDHDLVICDSQGVEIAKYNTELLDAIRNTVAVGATDDELYMFLQIASLYNLNPFLKEIWFVKMKGKNAIMTSRDGYLKIAKQNPCFVKCQSSAVFENDDFRVSYENGDVVKLEHSYSHKDRGKLLGAWAMVKDTNDDRLLAYLDLREYDQRNSVWRKYPSAMIRKCAENDVLKRFGNISGLMTLEDAPREYQKASQEYIDIKEISKGE